MSGPADAPTPEPRHRLQAFDWLLVVVLVPWFGLCIGLHIATIESAGAGVFVNGAGVEYPRVAGFWAELPHGDNDLEVGDVLLQLGSVDLRGVHWIRFHAIVAEQAPLGTTSSITYERDGVRRTTAFSVPAREYPWSRVPMAVGFALVGIIVMVRRPGSPDTRLLFSAFLMVGISQSAFVSPSREVTFVFAGIHTALAPFTVFLLGVWATRFPPGQDPRRRLGLWVPALAGLIEAIPTLSFHFGGPLPIESFQAQTYAVDGVLGAALVFILSWNYFRADPVGKRQVKWVVLGVWVAELPLTFSAVLAAAAPEVDGFLLLHDLGLVLAVAVPLGVLIAIVQFNLFDIDRLLGGTVSYTLLLVLLAILGEVMLEPLAALAASRMGFDPGTGQLVFVGVLAAALIPVQRVWRPHVDRIFFSAGKPPEEGIEALLEEIHAADHADGEAIVTLIATRVTELFAPVWSVAYQQAGSDLELGYAVGATPPQRIEGDPARELTTMLGVRVQPMRLHAEGRRDEHQSLAERVDALLDVPTAILVPIRLGGAPGGFVCLGRKQSGDVYTATDLSLLASVTHQTSIASFA